MVDEQMCYRAWSYILGFLMPMSRRRLLNVSTIYNVWGQRGQLRERTYSKPRKWMRGKGRVTTIQFGCCYNYAVDKNGNPPGIVRDEDVDPLPTLFKQMMRRMVSWHILPPTCIPIFLSSHKSNRTCIRTTNLTVLNPRVPRSGISTLLLFLRKLISLHVAV